MTENTKLLVGCGRDNQTIVSIQVDTKLPEQST
jgi:hypothetical protein